MLSLLCYTASLDWAAEVLYLCACADYDFEKRSPVWPQSRDPYSLDRWDLMCFPSVSCPAVLCVNLHFMWQACHSIA